MNESVWDIKQKLQQEKFAVERIQKSLKQWEQISSDVSTGVTNVSTSSHEWQIRFECQYQYNKMLMKQIQRMRAEIRILRNGNELPESFEIMKNMKTVGDWRKQIKDLNIEKWSLKSLQAMYERQLDSESMIYHRYRDELHKMTKDVRNTFEARIHEQELSDRKAVPAIPLTNSPRKQWKKLKPIAHILPLKAHHPVRNKTTQNYTNIFQSQRQIGQAQTGSTFSGLGSATFETIPENADTIPNNSEAIPENIDHISENSDPEYAAESN